MARRQAAHRISEPPRGPIQFEQGGDTLAGRSAAGLSPRRSASASRSSKDTPLCERAFGYRPVQRRREQHRSGRPSQNAAIARIPDYKINTLDARNRLAGAESSLNHSGSCPNSGEKLRERHRQWQPRGDKADEQRDRRTGTRRPQRTQKRYLECWRPDQSPAQHGAHPFGREMALHFRGEKHQLRQEKEDFDHKIDKELIPQRAQRLFSREMGVYSLF